MVNTTNGSINRNVDKSSAYLDPTTEDPQVIRAQIARTRAEMGQTLDEIQVRLSPDYIRKQTQDSIREATVEKVEQMTQTAEYKVKNWRSSAVQTVKENPIPSALIGLGIGWLLFSSNGNDDNGEGYYEDSRYSHPGTIAEPRYAQSYYAGGQYRGTVAEAEVDNASAAENAQEWVGDVTSDVQRKAENAATSVREQTAETSEVIRENVSDVATHAQEYVAETAAQARERAERARMQAQQQAEYAQRQVRRQTRRAKRTFWHTMEENPLIIGAGAAAAGALIGLALPSTEKENELMGETRDRLIEDASASVQQTVRKVQTVAEETAQTAVNTAKVEAEKQDLPTPSSPTTSQPEKTTQTAVSN